MALADQHRRHSAIVERLETLDKAAHRLSCALLTGTPFGNCLTTMVLRALGPRQAELAWSATFEADGLPARTDSSLLQRSVYDSWGLAAIRWLAKTKKGRGLRPLGIVVL